MVIDGVQKVYLSYFRWKGEKVMCEQNIRATQGPMGLYYNRLYPRE